MKTLRTHEAEDAVFALQDEIPRNDEAGYDHRLHALLLVAQGMSGRQAARLPEDAPRTSAYWVNRLEKEGFAGLVDAERPGRLNEDPSAELEPVPRGEPREYDLQGPVGTLSTFVEQRRRIFLGVRQCRRLFRRPGFRLRKPRSKIADADIGMQEEYKKLKILHKVGFEQQGTPCRMWVPPEIREPFVLQPPTRKSGGYFGAARPRDGKFFYRREECKFNGMKFFSFLKRLRRISSRSGRKIVVLTDNARRPHARLHAERREKKSLRLHSCRPTALNSTPLNELGSLPREKAHNRYFPSLREIIVAVEEVCKDRRHGSDVLCKLCAIKEDAEL